MVRKLLMRVLAVLAALDLVFIPAVEAWDYGADLRNRDTGDGGSHFCQFLFEKKVAGCNVGASWRGRLCGPDDQRWRWKTAQETCSMIQRDC